MLLNPLSSDPTNGQTHSIADELFEFDHFVELALKELTTFR